MMFLYACLDIYGIHIMDVEYIYVENERNGDPAATSKHLKAPTRHMQASGI